MNLVSSQQAAYPVLSFLALSTPIVAYSDAGNNLGELIRDVSENTARLSIYFNSVPLLRNSILDYFESKSVAGWDGYDALPITEDSKNTALKIVSHIPETIQRPGIR